MSTTDDESSKGKPPGAGRGSDSSADRLPSVGSESSVPPKKKTKEKPNPNKSRRGSLKFGGPEELDQPKKANETPTPKPDEPEKFNPRDHAKYTKVLFHKNNDLSESRGVGYTPEDAIRKHGPGLTPELETQYGPCALLTDFEYTTWAELVVPLKNHNVVHGFNELLLHLIKLAANGGANVSHEEEFLAVSFLSNIRNDLGEHPPNVLALLEHIDYLTRNDGSEKAEQMFVRAEK